MSKTKSSRETLRQLVTDNPGWSYLQYAEHLGQSLATIRGALSAMSLSRNKMERLTYVEEKPKQKSVAKPPTFYVASKASPTRSGYTKLL